MAETVEPYGDPETQQALVLERSGELAAAATAASDATRSEPTNWRTWLLLSGIEAAGAPPRPSMHTARRIGSTHGRLCSPRCLRRNSPRASIMSGDPDIDRSV